MSNEVSNVKTLTPDQFEFNEHGQLVIKDDQLTQVIQAGRADAASQAPEEGAHGVGIAIF